MLFGRLKHFMRFKFSFIIQIAFMLAQTEYMVDRYKK